MIDIHSHILPGLDDGARDMEESLAMLRVAAEAGTTDIVATPHSNLEFQFDPDLVDRKIAELAAASDGVVRIHRGCDFHLHFENIQEAIENPAKFAIAQKKHILVEFSDLLIARSTEEVFNRLLDAGLVPIITHPERNRLLQQRIERLERWVQVGCAIQVTAQSFFGLFGKSARRFAGELMCRGLVHIVASDAHDSRHRPPRLDEAYRYLESHYGVDTAELLCVRNPGAVLAGDHIEQPDAASPSARKWYRFWT
ncbi:MAG TPA: CpsB/CapC family capsule biosynthesis tyrosine phosphatase [Bryobacteraceae bacterium]|nr:CpsB/CapC family capsule biosynthesis tyrosine phosphatase [Bryobacteraceae bacterium]